MTEKDAQLELKKRARRRLVGAAALALLAAIVLPMVMEQEPRPITQDIQMRIPSQDAGAFTSRVLPAKPGNANPATEAAPVTAPAITEPAGNAPKEAAAVLPSAKPEMKAESPVTLKAVPKVEPKNAPKTEQKIAQVKAEKANAPTTPAVNGGDQFSVQLGVFADQANVRKVRDRIKAEGYDSYTEPLQTAQGIKTRVRAGPFAGREAAEKARDKLKHAGLSGIVAPK